MHPHRDTGALEVVHLHHLRGTAAGGLIVQGHAAGAGDLGLGRAIDVAVGVAADYDRLRPVRHQAGDVAADDRFAEDGAVEDVADGAVRAAPHLLQPELRDPRLVRRDRRALDADAVLADRLRGIDGHLVVGRVAVLDAKIEVQQLDVEIGQDQLVLDEAPDDPGHLVAVEFHDRILHLDLRHPAPSIAQPACAPLLCTAAAAAARSGDAGQTIWDARVPGFGARRRTRGCSMRRSNALSTIAAMRD